MDHLMRDSKEENLMLFLNICVGGGRFNWRELQHSAFCLCGSQTILHRQTENINNPR